MKTLPCQPDYPIGTKISPGFDLAGCTYSVRILWSETSESVLMPVPFSSLVSKLKRTRCDESSDHG